jgi:hypothetical protein
MNAIETERLLLEPLDDSGLDDFVDLTADLETTRYWWANGAFARYVAERNFRHPLRGSASTASVEGGSSSRRPETDWAHRDEVLLRKLS